ncbi:MAG: IclR family transcriptional regulator [Actinomycetota bacterium]|nr:IclR family transcriptional regulator [Actinomycetota bacterium]
MAGVQSIERAFALLRALSVGPGGVTELADRTELPKSTVSRILSALEEEGAVEQVEVAGEYRLGSGLLDLAGGAQPGRNLIASARPHLLELVSLIGEIAGVSTFDLTRGTVYYLDHAANTEEDVTVRDWTGESAPLHAVPSGLVVLAHLPDKLAEAYLEGDLTQETAFTMTDRESLRNRLADIRSIGYVWVYQEFREDINSVAAPVFDADGTVIAALHVHGPAYRFPNPDRTHDFGLQVVEAASRLANHLD